jgi:hypothetical protein
MRSIGRASLPPWPFCRCSDLEERALHPGKHARNACEVDVADEPAGARTLDVQLLHDALFEHRDAGFLWRYVDEDLMAHRGGGCDIREFLVRAPRRSVAAR